LETQRLRLLRIVAGLFLALGVLAVAPVSQRFSDWTLGFVGSVLSRIELAVRYMVVTQACLMLDRCGLDVARSQIAMPFVPDSELDTAGVSACECRRRLRAMRSVLMDLPRHALRLLRRIARQMTCMNKECCRSFEVDLPLPPHHWRLGSRRIERPPDKDSVDLSYFTPLPGCRAGGVGG